MKKSQKLDSVMFQPCQLDFGLAAPNANASILVGAASLPPMQHSMCDALSPASICGGRKRPSSKLKHAPLATISSVPSSNADGGQAAQMPLFLVASAAESKQPSNSVPTWRSTVGNLAAGAIAGCAVESALYPLDTIKTRLQAMIGGGGLKALLQSGGGKGLYAGLWGNLAGVAPASAIFISVYEPVKRSVEEAVSSDQQYLGALIAGGAAGTASSLIRVPTEVVKQRLQTGEYKSAVNALRTIISQEGIRRGMYAGYGALMLRDLPFDAIEFVCYEQLKVAAQAYLGRDLNTLETSVIGAGAGGFTGLATTPLDVIKTRLMVQGGAGRYKNFVDATVQIARTEGAAAFLKGWQPRLIWISLGGFVFFPALEAAKKAFVPPTIQPLGVEVEEGKPRK
mmetsp:Transcript_26642/g.72015  ORF Transcript_26642/g.72015 Transcript_26642/m.72015 type:complete len:397 (+) Transcript_26642:40-1230(+)